MAVVVDTAAAKELLSSLIDEAEANFHIEQSSIDPSVGVMIETIASSATAAYRQALVGTGLVKLLAPEADLTLPSTEFGDRAYSGRTIDETVVMPLFRARRIPVSASSAYLSTLRRGKRFVDEDVVGTRGRPTYLVVNALVRWLQNASISEATTALLDLIRAFLVLRQARQIDLIDLRRLSQRQVRELVVRLLAYPSGGALPILIVISALAALDEADGRGWTIEAQGINTADVSSGSVGDITVRKNEQILFGIEVTERRVDADRVRTAMTEKVMPASLTDYLYLVTVAPADDARELANNYFGQGYDVGFLDIVDWSAMALALTAQSRSAFARNLRLTLAADDIPASFKVAWNTIAADIVSQ